MSKKYALLLYSIIAAITIAPLQSVCPQEDNSVILDSLINEALEKNPEIKASHKAYLAAEERVKQAVSLDDPMFSAGYFVENVETRVGPQRAKYGVSQKFPFFGKLTLRGRIALRDRDIAFESYNAVKREIVKELKHTFFDLFWVRKSIVVTEEIKGLLDMLEKVAESKYSTGVASQQDVLKAQVEISRLIDKLLILDKQEVTLVEKLNTLLNRPVETPIGKIEDFDLTVFNYSLEELFDLAKEHRQELRAASLNVDKHKKIVSLKNKDYFPDFTFGVDFIDVGSGKTMMSNDGQDAWMVTGKVNVPIWLGRLNASVREAKNTLSSSEELYQNVNNKVFFQIKDFHFKLKTAKDLVNLYRMALVPQAEESLNAAQASYETGRTGFLDIIDSERILLNYKDAYFKAMADYEKTIADLERAAGVDFKTIEH